MAHIAGKTLTTSANGFLQLLLENVLGHEFLSLALYLSIFRLLTFQLLLDHLQSLLKHNVVILSGGLQRLLHDSFNHFLVPFDFELTISDTGHVLHHFLLRLHHELLALDRVLSTHLEIVVFIFLHSTLQR